MEDIPPENHCIDRARITVAMNSTDPSTAKSDLTIGSGQVLNICGSTFMCNSRNFIVDKAIVTTNITQIIKIYNGVPDLLLEPGDNISKIQDGVKFFTGNRNCVVQDSSFEVTGTQYINIYDQWESGRPPDDSSGRVENETFDIIGQGLFDDNSNVHLLGGSYVLNITQVIAISTRRSFTTQDHERWSKFVGISDFKYFQGASDFRIDKGDFRISRSPNTTESPFFDLGNIRITGLSAFDGAHDFVINDMDVTVNCIQSVFINGWPFLPIAVSSIRFGRGSIPRGVNHLVAPPPEMLLNQLSRGRRDPNDILNTTPGHVENLTHLNVYTSGTFNYNVYLGPVDQGDTFNGNIQGSSAGGRHNINSLGNTYPSAKGTQPDEQLKEAQEKLAKYKKLLKAKEKDLKRLETRLRNMDDST